MTSKLRSLNQTFGLLLASVIVPLLLGALLLLYVQARQEQRAAQRQLAVLAQSLLEAVERELAVSLGQLEVIATSPAIAAKDWGALYQFSAQVARRKPDSLIFLIRDDGQVLFNTATEFGSPQQNLSVIQKQAEIVWEGRSLPNSAQTLTKQVFDSGEPAFSDLYYGLVSRKPALGISVPVKMAGAVPYALTLSFPPDHLRQLISSVVTEPGLRAAVIDRRGLVIAANSATAARVGDKLGPITTQSVSRTGTYEAQSRDGTPLKGAYAVSKTNGFAVRISRPRETLLDFLWSTSAGWVALVMGSLLASVYFARRLANRIRVPLLAMGEAARSGQAATLSASQIAELDVLRTALQSGAVAEQERRDALVLDVKRAEAVAALQRADKQKDEFLATLAHELRNPLAPIRNATELIRRVASDDIRVQRPREIIERQIGHMARLVDDLLDVSRITLGTVQLRKHHLDLVALTSAASDAVKPLFAAAGLTLNEQFSGESPIVVSGDPLRLSQCISNLLNNAVKFTPRGGVVDLSVTRLGDRAEIKVTDNGIGIAAGSLDHIFELFVQERRSGSAGNSGLGIGLALTRKLAQLHSGSIEASSAGAGCGSTFRLNIPLVSGNNIPAANVGEGLAAVVVGTKVLIVDDNIDAADSLSDMLSLFGYVTSVAYSGEMACRIAAKSAPEAVLLDIGLPDISGYDVVKRIKGVNLDLIVVALTGWGQESDRQKSRDYGFDGHLTKPAEPTAVAELLNELLAKRRSALLSV